MQKFNQKVAVITGAASGIGCALAQECVSQGIAVVLADINHRSLLVLTEKFKSQGGRAIAVVTDVSQSDQVDALAEAAYEKFGQVDLLFNNAGVLLSGFSWEYSVADWKWILDVNLMGVVNGLHSFVPRMLAQNTEGHIVNTSSQAGLLSSPLMGPYAASKHAVVALTETLYFELALLGAKIHTSVLCPGAIDTDIMAADSARSVESSISMEVTGNIRNFLNKGVATGMSPQCCAERVFESIRNRQFWVFTDDEFIKEYRKRADSVIDSSNPREYYA